MAKHSSKRESFFRPTFTKSLINSVEVKKLSDYEGTDFQKNLDAVYALATSDGYGDMLPSSKIKSLKANLTKIADSILLLQYQNRTIGCLAITPHLPAHQPDRHLPAHQPDRQIPLLSKHLTFFSIEARFRDMA